MSGTKAQYKGIGTVNGLGKYDCLLTASDGQMTAGGGIDRFRIKIWDTALGVIIYDHALGAPDDIDAANPQAIGSGSIVIQKGKRQKCNHCQSTHEGQEPDGPLVESLSP